MIYRLDDLVLDTGRQSVHRAADHIALPKLSFDLLLALVRSAPNLVSSDDLMQQVWPGLVVSPETVVQRVKLLRDALGDDPRAPRYIAGLRGRGYQLIAPVAEVAAEPKVALPPLPTPLSSPEAPATLAPASLPRWRLPVVAIVAVCVAAGVWYGWHKHDTRNGSLEEQPSIAVLPFHNLTGRSDNDDIVQGLQSQISSQLWQNRQPESHFTGCDIAIRDATRRSIAGRQTTGCRQSDRGPGGSDKWAAADSRRADRRIRWFETVATIVRAARRRHRRGRARSR